MYTGLGCLTLGYGICLLVLGPIQWKMVMSTSIVTIHKEMGYFYQYMVLDMVDEICLPEKGARL